MLVRLGSRRAVVSGAGCVTTGASTGDASGEATLPPTLRSCSRLAPSLFALALEVTAGVAAGALGLSSPCALLSAAREKSVESSLRWPVKAPWPGFFAFSSDIVTAFSSFSQTREAEACAGLSVVAEASSASAPGGASSGAWFHLWGEPL